MADVPACGGAGQATRRGFLRAAGAAAGAGMLAACTQVRSAPAAARHAARLPSPAVTPPVTVSPAAADWRALQRGLSTHRLLQPGQPGYHTARLLFDPRFDDLRPAGVAYCATPADVALCLSFVRRFALPVAARSGGHSYGGWSGTPGLIVDVTPMNSFLLGLGGQSVTVGAGTHLIDLYHKLAGHGLAVPGGSCPTVGVAGLTLGGGVGVVGRAFGLSCDNLLAMQIVTADGSVLDIDPSHHADLFWACRGGGGGNFGVATSFTFRTHPVSSLMLFFLSWPWSQAERVIAGWQSWAPLAPDALWSNVHLSAAPGGSTPGIQVGGAYLGGIGALTALLDKLYAAVGSSPVSPSVQEYAYLPAMLFLAGCTGTVDQCHLPWQAPGGQLMRQPSYAKSDFFTAKLPGKGIRALLAGVEALTGVAGAGTGAGGVAFDAFGGALNRVAPDATAFVHRDALFLAQYSTEWGAGATSGQVASQHRWLRKFYASMRPFASGQCYQNYADPDLASWQQAYYGANYPRLAHVKGLYDPGQLFRFAQGITPGP